MTKSERDSIENEQEVISTRKNFYALNPRYFSNRTTYNPIGFNRPNFEMSSFIADWQLFAEENSKTYCMDIKIKTQR